MVTILYILIILVMALAAIVILRTILFKPLAVDKPVPAKMVADKDRAVRNLSGMIQIPTVSYTDKNLEDIKVFSMFRDFLEKTYPFVHTHCVSIKTGEKGILYHWCGKNAANPVVLMAHYDVVPAQGAWEKPPFSGVVENGVIWGRGTLDTKGTVCGILEAAEQLLAQGFRPEKDIYIAFAGDEETDGSSCQEIVSYLKSQGIRPGLVLDEGGAVVENVFPGVSGQCALIGIAEKGCLDIQAVLESSGGHASTPPVNTVCGELARAMDAVEKHPFKARLTKPVREMFNILGRHSNFGYRMIFANLWIFWPLLQYICRKSGGELNAMVRTTCAITMMEGSNAYNVLPPKASFGMNIRLMGQDSISSAVSYLKKVMKNEKIVLHVVEGSEPSVCSQTGGEAWNHLENTIQKIWPKALVSPYLMMACSDSRFYGEITDVIYRFSPMTLSKEERGMMHGNNERIPVETLVNTVKFYLEFIKGC